MVPFRDLGGIHLKPAPCGLGGQMLEIRVEMLASLHQYLHAHPQACKIAVDGHHDAWQPACGSLPGSDPPATA